MRYLYAVLLLSLACDTSEPRHSTFHQGAYRPAPPRFIPSQDAPHTVGQPGHLRPGVQVQPNPRHKRYLPPSREPGIWAGDEPKASLESAPFVVVEGFTIPLPDVASEEDKGHARLCEKILADVYAARHGELSRHVDETYRDMQDCAARYALAYCLRIPFEGGAPIDAKSAALSDRLDANRPLYCRDFDPGQFRMRLDPALRHWMATNPQLLKSRKGAAH